MECKHKLMLDESDCEQCYYDKLITQHNCKHNWIGFNGNVYCNKCNYQDFVGYLIELEQLDKQKVDTIIELSKLLSEAVYYIPDSQKQYFIDKLRSVHGYSKPMEATDG